MIKHEASASWQPEPAHVVSLVCAGANRTLLSLACFCVLLSYSLLNIRSFDCQPSLLVEVGSAFVASRVVHHGIGLGQSRVEAALVLPGLTFICLKVAWLETSNSAEAHYDQRKESFGRC